jgi:hypothetical protein
VKNSESGESRKEVSSGGRLPPDVEEERAREELEKIIEEHRLKGPAASAGAEQQNTQQRLGPAAGGVAQQQAPRRGAVERKTKDEILRIIRDMLKEFEHL